MVAVPVTYKGRALQPQEEAPPKENVIGGGRVYDGGGGAYIPQIERPEYELSEHYNVRDDLNGVKRAGYDNRIVGKVKGYGRKTNNAIDDLNQARRDHVDTVDKVNAQIGKPEAGAYKGFTQDSVNQAIAYARDKEGKGSFQGHWDNAMAFKALVEKQAAEKQKAVEEKFAKAGGGIDQAKRMEMVIAHLISRYGNDKAGEAMRERETVTPGLMAFAEVQPTESVGIDAMLGTKKGFA